MSELGVIALDRGIFDHPLFDEERKFSRMEAWVWLLSEAAWKPRVREISGAVITLERGQLVGSVRFMARAWGWSKSTVDRFIDLLEKRDMIKANSGTGTLVITICNYDKYQRVSLPAGQERDTAGTAAGQQRDKREDIQDIQEELDSSLRSLSAAPDALQPAEPIPAKPERKPKARSSRLAADWQPSGEMVAFAAGLGLSQAEIRHETEKIRDWSIGSPNGAKADWASTWRNWIRKYVETRSRNGQRNSNGFASDRHERRGPIANPMAAAAIESLGRSGAGGWPFDADGSDADGYGEADRYGDRQSGPVIIDTMPLFDGRSSVPPNVGYADGGGNRYRR